MPNCLSCTNQAVCSDCSWEKAFDPNGPSCDYCSDYVYYCAICYSTNFTCTSCSVGTFIYWGSGQSSCFNCSSNCNYCSNQTGELLCLFCGSGFYLFDNQCYACASGCSSCMNSSFCLYCLPSYYSSGSQCLSCPSGCLNCNGTACIACQSSLFSFNNSCISCNVSVANCNYCYTQGCISCNLGYYLVNSSSCQSCSPNCASCSNGTYCENCLVEYYNLEGSCLSCYPCAQCLNSSYCITCPAISNMGSTNNCPVCPNCQNCDEVNGCY
jgi:proprotein convertase subtilisin/kexin type 5